jgi:hypothetical protein
MKVKILFLLIIWLVLVQNIPAQNSAARFLLWQPSAKSNAMGGVGTTLYGDAFATYYNPAGLSFSKSLSLVGSVVNPMPFFNNIVHSYLSGSYRLKKGYGTFAVSSNLFWKGKQVVTDELGNVRSLDEKDIFHWQAKFSYATLLSKNISIGINISLLKISLAEFGASKEKGTGKTSTALFDFSILIKNLFPSATLINSETDMKNDLVSNHGFSIGVAFLNLGQKIAFIDQEQKDNPPSLISIGFSYWPLQSNIISLMFATDFEKQMYESSLIDYIHSGSEVQLLHFIFLRAGYFLDTFGPKNSYATIGAGVHYKFFSINLARYTKAILPAWHFDGSISVNL